MSRFASFLVLAVLAFAPRALAGEEAASAGGPSPAARAQVLAFVEPLRAEAARLRGLAWKKVVPAEVVTRAQARDLMAREMDEDSSPEERARDTEILRRLGLLGPDEDPDAMMLDAMEQMVGGFYDPKAKKLFLVEGMTGEAQEPVILHELIHALEDQYYDLEARIEACHDDPDRLFAEKCLDEGSAEHASALYQQLHPDVRRHFLEEQGSPELRAGQRRILREVPAFLLVPTLLQYDVGPRFVAQAVGDDYPGGMERLYAHPPVSEEEVLHPGRWLGAAKDLPQKVVFGADFEKVLGGGWKTLDQGTSGELDLGLYLDFFLGTTHGRLNPLQVAHGDYLTPEARRAANGWDGGRTIFLQKDGVGIAWIEALVFDTERDAREAYDAERRALERAYGDEARWGEDREGEKGARTVTYVGPYGPGRLAARGTALFLADGVPADRLHAVWHDLLRTRFVKDPGDTWDPARADEAFRAHDYADEEQGLCFDFGADGWHAGTGTDLRGRVTHLEKGGLQADISLVPASEDVIRSALADQLRMVPGMDVDHPEAVRIGGAAAVRFSAPGVAVYLGSTGGKTVLVTVRAEPDVMASLGTELEKILDGLMVRDD